MSAFLVDSFPALLDIAVKSLVMLAVEVPGGDARIARLVVRALVYSVCRA